MASHKFHIGESVNLMPAIGRNVPGGTCHGKLGLGVRYRNLWNGRWWVHTRFCSANCVERYNTNTKRHWFTFLYCSPQS
jgi:hypothetical protein